MKRILNVISLFCLSAGLGGIVCCRDWRLLLAFPVAFGLGLGRDAVRASVRDTEASRMFVTQLPWQKMAFVLRVFFSFMMVYFSGRAILHFTCTPDDLIWTKACWFAGLVLQPWFWRWTDPRAKAETISAFALTLPTAGLIGVFPKLTDVWAMAVSFALVVVLVVVHKILNRKGVAA